MKKIYLVGFMGSGKSTVGQKLSNVLNESYIDLDHYIEKSLGTNIDSIFRDSGEAFFRQYEADALKQISDSDIKIIATGGGIVESTQNINCMKQTGKIIYLHTSFEEIHRRLAGDNSRPLWKDDQSNRNLYQRRINLYQTCADFVIHSDKLTVEQQVEEIVQKLKV